MKKIIIILLCFLLTGCYNYNEIDDLAIISCLGIDYANGKYQIIIEEEKNDKDNKKSTLLYYSEDISLDKAIQKAAYKIDKTLYFIDLDVLLLSTNVANNHLNSVMDYITRENNFAFNFNMVLAENPRQIIETLDNKKNTISGKYIKNIFNAEFNSIINIKYSEFMETYLNGSKNVILPFASINDKGVTLDKAYLFNNSKLTYLLKSQNMQIYNLLNSYNKIYLFKIKYKNQYLIYKVLKVKTKISYKNKKIIIKTSLIGAFDEMENVDIKNRKKLELLSNKVEAKVNADIVDFLNICSNTNSDPLGFKKVIYNNTRKKTKNINKLNYEIKVDINIDREGLIFNSVGDAFEKNN